MKPFTLEVPVRLAVYLTRDGHPCADVYSSGQEAEDKVYAENFISRNSDGKAYTEVEHVPLSDAFEEVWTIQPHQRVSLYGIFATRKEAQEVLKIIVADNPKSLKWKKAKIISIPTSLDLDDIDV